MAMCETWRGRSNQACGREFYDIQVGSFVFIFFVLFFIQAEHRRSEEECQEEDVQYENLTRVPHAGT